jgi:hypothetical protein
MRKTVILAVVAAVLAGGTVARAQEAPKMPAPQKEHQWLGQLAGEWDTEAEMLVEPGKPTVKNKGTMSTRILGGYWAVSDVKGDFMGAPFSGLMTVGFDVQKKKYVGTWVGSMCDWLCKYEGTAAGNILTLNTEGPNPADPSKLVKMRDVIELKDKDHQVMTSSMLGEDGKWITFMTLHAKRKK